jgi:NTP pyrophosphohydrolases including oxidative damage repair enzymes
MDYFEETVSREEKYKGIIIDVHMDRARLCDGSIVKREVVEHPGGVTILPVDADGNCFMVRQFRYPMGRMMLEAPAGKLEKNEEHYDCAVRELSEETGLTADKFVYLGGFCTSPGFSTEVLHIYLALGLHHGKSHPDEGEFLNVEKHPIDELVSMIMANEIDDGKTVIAVMKAKKYLEEN